MLFFWKVSVMALDEKIGLGYCGIACSLCGLYSKGCPGCAAGVAGGFDCSVGKCAAAKGVEGCYACSEYPCGEKILQGKRSKAFIRYVREFGNQAFIERLRVNGENGIAYSTNAKRTEDDDYDKCETEREIIDLLMTGINTPGQALDPASTDASRR